MPTNLPNSALEIPSPGDGMAIVAVTTYEELPIVTDEARQELLDSLAKGEEDLRAGRVKAMTVPEFVAELRAKFEAVTGYKAP